MSDLEARASKVCIPPPSSSVGIAKPGAPSGSHDYSPPATGKGFLGSTPAGQAASLVGDALQMFASSQAVSAVVGTVRDQALMNEVARQLRSLNVLVLVPEIYNPNALNRADNAGSPYFKNLESLFDSYEKCEAARAGYSAATPEATDINSVINSIDSFLKIAVPAVPPTPADKSSNATAQPAANVPSHFAVVFSADEVARQLGFNAEGSVSSATWQHVLWLKALESGGSVIRKSNILRTRVRFSGGAVDTYALFRLGGELVCSGNVYNFQSPVRINDLRESFRAKAATLPADSPVLRTTCPLLPPLAKSAPVPSAQ